MSIYGAIIGDVAGSYHEVLEMEHLKNGRSLKERTKILKSTYPLFTKDSNLTDDSILTLAIADAILSGANYEVKLREYGLAELGSGKDKYGRDKFGPNFIVWLTDKNPKANSFGNGASMRVSPIGYAFDTLEQTLIEAKKSAIVTHNASEAIECCKAVAGSIFLARNKKDKNEIKLFVESLIGSVDFDLKTLQTNNRFTSQSSKTVPQAIYCFLISKNYKDAIRKAISIGGDTDTIACIAGSIAGAFYGVPKNLIKKVKKYISKKYIKIIDEFNNKYCTEKN